MMEERRKWKSIHSEENCKKYKSLNYRLRQITDKAREKWWNEQCAELEKHERQGKMDLLYRKVSKLTNRKRKKRNLRIRDKEGNVLSDSDKVRGRCKECIEDLYDKNNKPQEEDMRLETDTEDDVKGPPILFSGFEAALSELKMERQKEKMGYRQNC